MHHLALAALAGMASHSQTQIRAGFVLRKMRPLSTAALRTPHPAERPLG